MYKINCVSENLRINTQKDSIQKIKRIEIAVMQFCENVFIIS